MQINLMKSCFKSFGLLGMAIIIVAATYCKKDGDDDNDDELYYDVVIVGGGISGLLSGYYLKDMNVMILEKEDVAGGRIASGEWEGFHFPKGMEYIGEPEPEYNQLFSQLGLTIEQIPPPTDGVAYDGNIYHSGNILDYLGPQSVKDHYYQLMDELEALNTQVDDAVWNNQDNLDDFASLDNQSVFEWLEANSYEEMIRKYVNIENRGLFGANNQDLSMLFNIPEMAFDMPDSTEYTESEVYSFPNGMIDLVNALMGQLTGKITLGATVTQVTVNDDLSATIKYIKSGETLTIHADAVIMATPAPITNSIVTNGLSQDVRDALSEIIYAQYITLNLFTSERLITEAWTLSCIDDYFVTLYDAIRTQVPLNYTDKAIMGVYIAPENANDHTLIDQTDDDILQNTYADLEKYFPDIQSKILGYDIHRIEYAFPVFNKNYHQKIQTLIEDLSVQGPLFLTGDYMMYATFDGAFWGTMEAVWNVNDYMEDK